MVYDRLRIRVTWLVFLLWMVRQPLSNAGWCKGGMIWDEVIGKDERSATIQKFFVGTEDQFRMQVDPAGKTFSPCG